MSRFRLKKRPNKLSWRRLFAAIPLLLLAVDYLVFPVIFEAHQTERDANIADLLTHQTLPLGTIRGHRIHVSIDDIRDSEYLAYLKDMENALVISAFIDSSGSIEGGSLQRAVKKKLESVSPDDCRKFVEIFEQNGNFSAGDVIPFALDVPKSKYHEFPIDHVLILTFYSGASVSELDRGISEILRLAEKKNVVNLILPCLGLYWKSQGSLQFNTFFDSFFNNLTVRNKPRDVYLSLYTQWPSFVLEEAIESLNSSWNNNFLKLGDKTSMLYRRDFRFTLLFLSLCLCVCSFYATLTLTNFFIISLSFVGIVLASNEFIDFFTQGYAPTVKFILQVIIWAVAAFGFRFIVNWNPQNIFKTNEK